MTGSGADADETALGVLSRKIRLLVVDDVEPLLVAIEKTLVRRILHIEIHTARSANEAISLADQVHPHVVLTDYNLQGVSGLELALRLRLTHPKLSIAIMSAYSNMPLSLSGLGAAGVDCLLQKPFNPVSLTQAIRYLANTPSDRRARIRSTGALHVTPDVGDDGALGSAAPTTYCASGHLNPSTSRFCGDCGKTLTKRAPELYDPYRGNAEVAEAFRARLRDPDLLALYNRGMQRMLKGTTSSGSS